MARTTSYVGPVDPVQFPVVLVNEGNAWQTTSNNVIIPRQGYYFLHIGGGINTNREMQMNIFVNNVRSITTNRWIRASNDIDMSSRGGILQQHWHYNRVSNRCTRSPICMSAVIFYIYFITYLPNTRKDLQDCV